MRCDVCGYKIMPGQHECPNCGYKWDDGHVNTFDRNAYDHSHIQNKPKSQVRNNESQPRKTVINPKSTIKKGNMIQTVVKIFVGIWIVGLVAGLVGSLIDNVSFIFEDDDTYTSSSIEEAIEYGYDYEDILEREEDVIAFFENLGFADIDTYDYVGTGSYVSFTVYAYDDDYTMYEIQEVYMDDKLYETTFATSGYLENSIQTGDLMIDKDIIDTIDDYIECGNLYDMINVYRSQMSYEGDDSYSYYGDDIYFSEDYSGYDDNAPYYYYFSIDF